MSLQALQNELQEFKAAAHAHLKKEGAPWPLSVKFKVQRPAEYAHIDVEDWSLKVSLLDAQCLDKSGPSFNSHVTIDVISDLLPGRLRSAMARDLLQTLASLPRSPTAPLGLASLRTYTAENYGHLLSLLHDLLDFYEISDENDVTVRRVAIINSPADEAQEASSAAPAPSGPLPSPQPIDPSEGPESTAILPGDLLALGYDGALVSELEGVAIRCAPQGPLHLHLSPDKEQLAFAFLVKPQDPGWSYPGNLSVQGKADRSGASLQIAVKGPLNLGAFVRQALTAALQREVTNNAGRRNFLRRAVADLENRCSEWLKEAVEAQAAREMAEEEEDALRGKGEGDVEEADSTEDEEDFGDGGVDYDSAYSDFSERAYESGAEDEASRRDAQGDPSPSRPTAEHALTSWKVHLEGLKLGCDCIELCKAVLTVCCKRCRGVSDLAIMTDAVDAEAPRDRGWFPKSAPCSGCSQPLGVSLLPRIAHTGSAVICLLRTEDCTPVDIVGQGSIFGAQCSTCGATVSLRDLEPSVPCIRRCNSCHSTLSVQFALFSFVSPKERPTASRLQAGEGAGGGPRRTRPITRKEQLSSEAQFFQQPRVLGQPLPNHGACRHYPHSYRWLRFSCCGRLFPCDLCHEEHVAHEMKWATRCVCGFCAAEQPCSNECKACGKKITASSSNPRGTQTKFWEGGKGNRDWRRMENRDPRKWRLKAREQRKKIEAQLEAAAKNLKKKS